MLFLKFNFLLKKAVMGCIKKAMAKAMMKGYVKDIVRHIVIKTAVYSKRKIINFLRE